MAIKVLFGVADFLIAKTNGSLDIPKTASGLTTACKLLFKREQKEFKVLKVMRSRPGGSQFGIGNLFNEVGLAQSGLFCGRELLLACDVPNQESGFMGISGKYTERYGYYSFGERNVNDKLNGKVILISPYDQINIGYFDNGLLAPGNYIRINSGGSFDVGDLYLKAGLVRGVGTHYKTDGTT